MHNFVKHLPVEYLRFSELSQLLLWEETSSKYKHLPFWRCQLWGTSCWVNKISSNAVPEIYPTFQFLKPFLTLQNILLNSVVLFCFTLKVLLNWFQILLGSVSELTSFLKVTERTAPFNIVFFDASYHYLDISCGAIFPVWKKANGRSSLIMSSLGI